MTLWALFWLLWRLSIFYMLIGCSDILFCKESVPCFCGCFYEVSVSQPVSDLVLPVYPTSTLLASSAQVHSHISSAAAHFWVNYFPHPSPPWCRQAPCQPAWTRNSRGFTPGLAQSEGNSSRRWSPRFPPLISKIKAFVIILWTNSASINKKVAWKQFWSGWQKCPNLFHLMFFKGKSGWFI